jgi:hypothetical protein
MKRSCYRHQRQQLPLDLVKVVEHPLKTVLVYRYQEHITFKRVNAV